MSSSSIFQFKVKNTEAKRKHVTASGDYLWVTWMWLESGTLIFKAAFFLQYYHIIVSTLLTWMAHSSMLIHLLYRFFARKLRNYQKGLMITSSFSHGVLRTYGFSYFATRVTEPATVSVQSVMLSLMKRLLVLGQWYVSAALLSNLEHLFVPFLEQMNVQFKKKVEASCLGNRCCEKN